jgi:hypothetical protein
MPFGLKNAGQRFQRLIDRVLAGLDFVFIYLDEVIVGSATEEEHLQHLRLVFNRLQKFGLVLNTDKCQFGVQQVEFLGHSITAGGAVPLFKHVQAVRDFQQPGPRSYSGSSAWSTFTGILYLAGQASSSPSLMP